MKEAYEHDYDGAYKPTGRGNRFNTFSVGIFQLLPMVRGKGLKRGKVKLRIRGNVEHAEAVYREAEYWCRRLDKEPDMVLPGKTITVS